MSCRFSNVLVILITMGALLAPLSRLASAEPSALPAPVTLPSLPSQETFGMKRPPHLQDIHVAQMMPSLERRNTLRDLEAPLTLSPLEWPVYGQISSGFGMRQLGDLRRAHEGIDIPVPLGTPIKAAHGGVVAESCVYNGYGKTVVLDHGQGVKTLYAHCSKLLVRRGLVMFAQR